MFLLSFFKSLICLRNWKIVRNRLTGGIFIRCHLVLHKCGLWCSLISACSTCNVWALCAGSVPHSLLKEPLHLCQGQVEICCTLLIGQSAFQTQSYHIQISCQQRISTSHFSSCPPLQFWSTFRCPCTLSLSESIIRIIVQMNYNKVDFYSGHLYC